MKAFNSVICTFIVCASSFTVAQQSLSFDTLFPVFWYERSVQSTMRALHEINSLANDSYSDKQQDVVLTAVIGHLSFAHFCIMHLHKGIQPFADDSAYFFRLLNQCAELLGGMRYVHQVRDQVECALYTVHLMQQQLQIKAHI